MTVAGVFPRNPSPDVADLAGRYAKLFGKCVGLFSGGPSPAYFSDLVDIKNGVFPASAKDGKPMMLVAFAVAPFQIINRVVRGVTVYVVHKRQSFRVRNKGFSDKPMNEAAGPKGLGPQADSLVESLCGCPLSAASPPLCDVPARPHDRTLVTHFPRRKFLDFHPAHFGLTVCSMGGL